MVKHKAYRTPLQKTLAGHEETTIGKNLVYKLNTLKYSVCEKVHI